MDRFTVIVDPSLYFRWPRRSQGFQPAEIAINGAPLISLVAPFEEPWVAKENEASGGELRAGDYHYPSVEWIADLRRPDDEALVLGCTCGVLDCWAILVRIERDAKTVRWSNFRHNHRRHWRYDVGPFVFDRDLYEAELVKASA